MAIAGKVQVNSYWSAKMIKIESNDTKVQNTAESAEYDLETVGSIKQQEAPSGR